jgi:heptosyltransferase-2
MDSKEIKNILVLNLGGIGDVLLSFPALKALRGANKKSRIIMLVVPRVAGLVKDLRYIDEVKILNRNGLLGNLFMLLGLRSQGIDLAINMRTMLSAKSASKIRALFFLAGAKVKAGRDTCGRGGFFDVKIPETDFGEKPEMDYDLELVDKLGCPIISRDIGFSIDQKSLNKIDDMLKSRGVSGPKILVGLHITGKTVNRWPFDFYARAASLIGSRNKSVVFALIGSKEDNPLCESFSGESSARILNFCGKFSISETIAFIKRCSLFISNDSGPMHIAAALKIPQIALFGSGDLKRYDPRNINDKAVVLCHKINCSPCLKMECPENMCMKNILPQEVADEALRILGV